MRTRIIQNDAEPPTPPAAAADPPSERPESRNLAARAVHWSANHRLAAIRGGLAFLVVAVLIGALSIALNMFPCRVRAMALDGLEDPVSYTRGTAAQLSPGVAPVVRRLEAVSRIGGSAMGWLIGAPCTAWPA
jgi:hypothetical protein